MRTQINFRKAPLTRDGIEVHVQVEGAELKLRGRKHSVTDTGTGKRLVPPTVTLQKVDLVFSWKAWRQFKKAIQAATDKLINESEED